MILKDMSENVETTGLGRQQSFKINASAKAFTILSSTLYSDPITAIIRELSCNAYDSHIAAGCKNTPFRVKLPNSIDKSFYVEDDGIGLSEDDVMNLYTTYFESTKSDSNDYVGALGLGSKTPFSYTKSFIVISRFNGQEMTFSAFIDKSGGPSIAMISSEDTDRPNGVRVEIAITENDMWSFRNRAEKVFRAYEVQPEVLGCPDFKTKPYGDFVASKKIKGNEHVTKWDYYKSTNQYENATFIIQGNIEYPVNSDLIETPYWMNKASIVMHVPIGTFEFSASREELHYSEDSKEALQSVIDAIKADITETIQKDVNAVKTQYAWRGLTGLQDAFSHHSDIKWRNKKVANFNDTMYMLRDENRWITDFRRNYNYSENGASAGIERTSGFKYYIPDNVNTIVIADQVGLAATKTKELGRSIDNLGSVGLLKLKGKTQRIRAWRGKEFLRKFGFPTENVFLASELKVPETHVVVREKAKGIQVNDIQVTTHCYDRRISSEPAQPAGDVVHNVPLVMYVPFYNKQPVYFNEDGERRCAQSRVVPQIELLRSIATQDAGYTDYSSNPAHYKVIGVPLQHLDIIDPDWVTLEEGIEKLKQELLSDPLYDLIVKYKPLIDDDGELSKFLDDSDAYGEMTCFSDIKAAATAMAKMRDNPLYNKIVSLASSDVVAPNSEFDHIKREGIYAAYPMLKPMLKDVYYWDRKKYHDTIAEYIDLVNTNSV